MTFVIDIPPARPWTLLVHGGAGQPHQRMTTDRLAGIHQGLTRAYEVGEAVLRDGGAALDAVCAAVAVLEDEPVFNCGRGAALTAAGTVEHDAAVMTGDGRGGAVTLSRHTRHPVQLARAIRDRSPHVLLADPPDDVVSAWGLELARNEWFVTADQRRHLADVQAEVAHEQHGTVGAVALDVHGHLAAATSTGGVENQSVGRIGDTPILGAGTWARDGIVAVSCTGVGEAFMQGAVAHQVSARMEYAGQDLADAAQAAIASEVTGRGAYGALIAVTPQGRGVMVWDAPVLQAAWRDGDRVRTRI